MNVLEFLPHHVAVLNLLRMTAFLPELIIAIGLVPRLVPLQLPEQCFDVTFLQKIDDLSGRVRFEIADLLAQILG